MAKVTTIIDIGSNSMRMVVLKKSSRFAFNLINETKSRVKISEGSYENDGYLQAKPMQRAYDSLKSFLSISKSLDSRKIICVATSALRDAPNSKEFLKKISQELKLNIRIIDGVKEAYYGGVAALNLLHCDDFMTVDIGGGSTEFCFIKAGKIEKSISLNIGTIRLKELFFNKEDTQGAQEFISNKLKELLDYTNDIPRTVVGIGGTIRALSKLVMKKNHYPLDVIHGFEYNVNNETSVFDEILNAKDNDELKEIGLKKDRFDTIKEGALIFKTIVNTFKTKKVIASGAGVREGVYLTDLLRTSNHKFPSNFNPSVKSLLDRFELDAKQNVYFGNNAGQIFDVLKPLHKIDDKYKILLVIASKLHSIGVVLNFYNNTDNTFDFILNGLNYDFLHSSRVLVAHIIKFSKKSLPKQKDIELFEDLLPSIEIVQWLSFMITLNITLNQDFSRVKYTYTLDDKELCISADEIPYIIKNNVDKIETPKNCKIRLI